MHFDACALYAPELVWIETLVKMEAYLFLFSVRDTWDEEI